MLSLIFLKALNFVCVSSFFNSRQNDEKALKCQKIRNYRFNFLIDFGGLYSSIFNSICFFNRRAFFVPMLHITLVIAYHHL